MLFCHFLPISTCLQDTTGLERIDTKTKQIAVSYNNRLREYLNSGLAACSLSAFSSAHVICLFLAAFFIIASLVTASPDETLRKFFLLIFPSAMAVIIPIIPDTAIPITLEFA